MQKEFINHLCLCPSLSQIFHYDHPNTDVLHKNFSNRLEWRGTPDSDVQTATIYIHNITYNDIGTYRCTLHRTLHLPLYDEQVTVEKQVELNVVAVGKSGLTCTDFSTMLFWKEFSLPRKKRYTMSVFCFFKMLLHCWFPYSQPRAHSSDLGDNDVRADCGSAAVAHRDSGVLLQEDFEGARRSGST